METFRDDDFFRLNLFSDFIEDFVAPKNRARLHYLLSKPKRRHEILYAFHDSSVLDERYLHRIAPRDSNSERIYDLMKARGEVVPCFRLSFDESPFVAINLRSELDKWVEYSIDTILFCPKVKVGYWQGDFCERAIFFK